VLIFVRNRIHLHEAVAFRPTARFLNSITKQLPVRSLSGPCDRFRSDLGDTRCPYPALQSHRLDGIVRHAAALRA